MAIGVNERALTLGMYLHQRILILVWTGRWVYDVIRVINAVSICQPEVGGQSTNMTLGQAAATCCASLGVSYFGSSFIRVI